MAPLTNIPASTCPGCSRPGIVSTDQTNSYSKMPLENIRFGCVCGRTWTASRHWAELHGRFLDRSGLR